MVALSVVACVPSAGVRSTGAAPGSAVSTSSFPDTSSPVVSGPGIPSDPSGDDGVGDGLFPALGNRGIDVLQYDIDLSYDTTLDALEGTVRLDVVFTEGRSEFTLDAVGLDVRSVTVDGVAAGFRSEATELRITPAELPRVGVSTQVEVSYSAGTGSRSSPIGFDVGWSETAAGSYVVNEPDGARYWLPSNDHPSDKATYRITLHVPHGVTAVANGDLLRHEVTTDGETWVWSQEEPTATYVLQVLTGDYEVVTSPPVEGVPLVSVVLRSDRARLQQYLDLTALQMRFFVDSFGPYPLARYGLAITDSPRGLAMETQGRSLFSRDDLPSTPPGYTEHLFLAHELAHQWFGDAVSPARWTDVWLNESFATYAEWLWLDHAGLESLQQSTDDALRNRGNGATGSPTVDQLFGTNVYDGGAVVLHALRLTIGDRAFFRTLRQWVAANVGESRTTADFIALATKEAGTDLSGFFSTWLFAGTTPRVYPAAVSGP